MEEWQGCSRAATTEADRPIAFLVSTTGCTTDIRRHMGSADYSYSFVLDALKPVLDELGTWQLIERPESRLAHLAAKARGRGPASHPPLAPAAPEQLLHVERPHGRLPVLRSAPTSPTSTSATTERGRTGVGCVEEHHFVLTACEFTASAFQRAGVEVPVAVVPVPLPPEPFETPMGSIARLVDRVSSSRLGRCFDSRGAGTAGHPDIVEDGGVGKTAFVKAIGGTSDPGSVRRRSSRSAVPRERSSACPRRRRPCCQVRGSTSRDSSTPASSTSATAARTPRT